MALIVIYGMHQLINYVLHLSGNGPTAIVAGAWINNQIPQFTWVH